LPQFVYLSFVIGLGTYLPTNTYLTFIDHEKLISISPGSAKRNLKPETTMIVYISISGPIGKQKVELKINAGISILNIMNYDCC